ncbi:hypothetical protein CBM2615_A240444 [Cupriavidus taiwanensis]|nr:hypothetical protein CBM2615_A240444 [Cupriavidus taiwanensis]
MRIQSSSTSPGGVAEWLCSGLQSRVRRFDSDLRLQLQAERRPLGAVFVFTGRFHGPAAPPGRGGHVTLLLSYAFRGAPRLGSRGSMSIAIPDP